MKSSRKVHGEELDALAGGILRFGIATRAARIIKRIGRSVSFKILSPLQEEAGSKSLGFH
ncbi:MAG TPA: hypothetical protein VEL71_05515 [Candidatus Dormibacteraeota bacterium]|nr:hypothetical protein [Candidatus Dormibacteraeota bacterium]